ncbi:MAG: YqeG family HAD IIIA-type phosphatase [Clostridia bacterium]
MANIKKNSRKKTKGGILKRFYPDFAYNKVEDIPYELLKENNIQLVMLDMDNTLVDHNYKCTEQLKKWAFEIEEKGIELYILTNCPMTKRVEKISKDLGMKYYHRANKPFLKGYRRVLEISGVPIENVAMVGDQMFTDIWGGNRIGLTTILVNPIQKKEWILTKIKRPIERKILNSYLKKQEGEK